MLETQTRHLDRAKPLKRELHFSDQEVWSYAIGVSDVYIRSPDLRATYKVSLSDVTGMTLNDIEHDSWKRNWEGVTPSMVKDYIGFHLRDTTPIAIPSILFFIKPWDGDMDNWKPWNRWHLSQKCPEFQHVERSLFVKLTPTQAETRLGAPLTRKNLCGLCRIQQKYTR